MNIYLAAILAIIVLRYLLELIVEILNLRHFSPNLPAEFAGCYDADRYRKSQQYLRDHTRLGIVAESISTPLAIAFILLGGFNLVDRWARSFHFGLIPTGLIFAAVLLLISELLRIPFALYRTFVVEERYGFNRTTPRTFVLDIVKNWILTALIGGLVFSVVIWFFDRTGRWAWLLCWAAVTAFQMFILFIAPVLILPLFNKFIPLEEGELKTEIEGYARSQDFKLKGIFKMDASRRSSKSNAFFTGLGKFKRIVLYDTLISRLKTEELTAVLAHEMGHFKKRHIRKLTALAAVTTGIMFFILSFFINNPGIFSAFKMAELSVYAGVIFFAFLYSPLELLLSIAGNILSRRYEYEADRYAAETYAGPQALILGLKNLSVDNLSNLTPHPLKVFLSYRHPPILERIRALRGN